ncbi:MAG: Ig-like domain-containing protein, partial [Bifidobacteriaceae bacterium]|nr:Ig-like domain-containing protein [Bifidobacteriaceae bacterium]
DGRTIDLRPGGAYLEPRTGSGGVASIDFTTDVAGTYRVYAALVGLPGTSEPVHLPQSGQVTATFTALPDPDLTLSSLTGTDASPRPVGGADPEGIHTATVSLVDTSPAHNPIPAMAVEFRITGVGTPVDATTLSTVTNAEGVARLRIASDTAGVARVSARVADPATPTAWITVPAHPAGTSTPAEHLALVFDPGSPEAATSTFTVSQGPKVADGVAAHTIDVTLRDAWGNAIPDAAETLVASSTPDDGVTIGPFTARGPASSPFDGRYTAPVTSTVPGTKTIAVRTGALDIPAGTDANRDAVFTPRPASPFASQIVIQAPRIVLAGDGTAPGSSTIAIITLRDQDGRELGADGAGATIALTSTLTGMRWSDLDGVPGIVTDQGDGTYAARVSSQTVGLATVGFTINGAPASSTDQVRFTTAPLPPVPTPSDGSELTGSGEAGSIIIVTTEDGETVGQTTVNPDGTWQLRPSSPLDVGSIVTISQTDEHGRVSERVLWRIGQPKILVDRPEVAHGDTQTARAINFQPGETIRGTLHSTPVDLGEAQANSNGAAIFTFAIPAGFDSGEHRVEGTGPLSGPAELARFTVTEPAPPTTTPPASPAPATPATTAPTPEGTITPAPAPSEPAPRDIPTTAIAGKPGVHPPTGIPAITIPTLGTALGLTLAGLFLLATKRRRDQR